jgi:hypothetical protein
MHPLPLWNKNFIQFRMLKMFIFRQRIAVNCTELIASALLKKWKIQKGRDGKAYMRRKILTEEY